MPDVSSSTDIIPYLPPKPPEAKRAYVKRNLGGPRVPPADGGIQSNFCRNINCENFGVEPLPQVQQGRTKKGQIRAGDGYVFGMQTNIDPSVDTERMEAEAIVAGDFAISEPSFRRFARFWTTPDYETAKIDDPVGVPSRLSDTGDVRADVVASYDEMAAIADPEAKERAPTTTALPTSCAQVHFEYTVHAHFRLLRRMLGDVGKIRFFMDQDDTLRAGCISTYVEEMRAGRADAFYVKIDKGLNVDQRMESCVLIESKAGTQRANHYHRTDWHYCYVLDGEIHYYERPHGSAEAATKYVITKGQLFFTGPMLDHTMVFTKDTAFLTWGRNSRAQEVYEADIVRIPSLAP